MNDTDINFATKFQRRKKLKTSKQHTNIQEKCNVLQWQISSWRKVQLAYTPHSASTIAETDDPGNELAENMKLWLPSSLPLSVRYLSDMKHICSAEHHLRYAQCLDSLVQIQRQRRIIQGLWQFNKINIFGTGN